MSCNHPCHVARSSYLAGMQGCKDRPRGKRRDFPLLSCLSPGLPSAASDISSFQYFYTLYTLPHHSLSIVALISTAFSLFSHIGHFTGSLTHHFIITGHYKRCSTCFFNIQYISASKCWLKEVQSLTEDLCVCACACVFIFLYLQMRLHESLDSGKQELEGGTQALTHWRNSTQTFFHCLSNGIYIFYWNKPGHKQTTCSKSETWTHSSW